MERLNINTGLDGFVCIDSVFSIDSESIKTSFEVPEGQNFTITESMAQTGALHLRYLTDLKRFVFLLKIKEVTMPEIEEKDFIIEGKLTANSEKAYSYKLTADNGSKIIKAEMVFAAENFIDNAFEDSYRKHYKKVFQCLVKNSEEK